MVHTYLIGGLGNQISQYAFGLNLSRQLDTQLMLDIGLLESNIVSKLNNITPRSFELDIFGISRPSASLMNSVTGIIKARVYNRSILLRDADIELLQGDLRSLNKYSEIYCLGYFHQHTFFTPIESIIREKLRFQKPLSDETKLLSEKIDKATNSVFLHVRRGDYISNSKAVQTYITLDESYYTKAIHTILEHKESPKFFVFSDDPSWVKSNYSHLISSGAMFVNHNSGLDSWQDMYLMSRCKHAITANSSFSWWGAWLIDYKSKLIVTPNKWFTNQSSEYIIPQEWICM